MTEALNDTLRISLCCFPHTADNEPFLDSSMRDCRVLLSLHAICEMCQAFIMQKIMLLFSYIMLPHHCRGLLALCCILCVDTVLMQSSPVSFVALQVHSTYSTNIDNEYWNLEKSSLVCFFFTWSCHLSEQEDCWQFWMCLRQGLCTSLNNHWVWKNRFKGGPALELFKPPFICRRLRKRTWRDKCNKNGSNRGMKSEVIQLANLIAIYKKENACPVGVFPNP